MRGSFAAVVVSCGLVVAAGAAAAAGGPVPRAVDAPTTTGSTSPPKPTDPPRAQPTTTLAPTTAVEPTTLAPANTLAPAPTTAAPPATAEPSGTFDPAGYFRDIYFTLSIEPADLLQDGDIDQTVLGSPAELFVFYLFSFGVVHRDNTTAPLPLFTVTPDGDELDVCAENGDCEVFGKFATRGGELRSFSIDGQPIDDRLGGYFRATSVEALTVDAAVVFKRPANDVLSIIVLFFSEDGATTFTWEEAFFLDENGRQFSPDLDSSLFPERVESETFGSAMLEFPAARPDGQLVIPITTEQTGEPTVIRIPVRLGEF